MAEFRAPVPNIQPVNEKSSLDDLIKFARDMSDWAAQMREAFDQLSKYVP